MKARVKVRVAKCVDCGAKVLVPGICVDCRRIEGEQLELDLDVSSAA